MRHSQARSISKTQVHHITSGVHKTAKSNQGIFASIDMSATSKLFAEKLRPGAHIPVFCSGSKFEPGYMIISTEYEWWEGTD